LKIQNRCMNKTVQKTKIIFASFTLSQKYMCRPTLFIYKYTDTTHVLYMLLTEVKWILKAVTHDSYISSSITYPLFRSTWKTSLGVIQDDITSKMVDVWTNLFRENKIVLCKSSSMSSSKHSRGEENCSDLTISKIYFLKFE
jgi:hypothetical protein